MLEKQPFLDQRIMNCLNADYGIEVASLTFLPLGADGHASLYKAEAHDQSSYFVKLKHDHQDDIGPMITAFLHDAGLQHVIPIIRTPHGQLTSRSDDFSLVVFPFIDGQDGFSRDLTQKQWYLLGKVMRQVHDMNVPASIQGMIRQESFSPKCWQAVRKLYPYMESGSGGDKGGDETSLKLLAFIKKHKASIHRLVDRAEQLSQKIQNQAHEFVLCHSNIHGGNVLIDKNEAIYIVDWDGPIMAPKERDLMFMGGGVANVWNKPHEEELFYKGYGMTEINWEILSYYRHERIVEDIAIYGQQLLLTTEGGHDRIEMYQQFAKQFDPQGVVNIAFKTDENLGRVIN
ncbi:MAG: phosphotransferase family protein [Candidatus Paracaedibacter sp.]